MNDGRLLPAEDRLTTLRHARDALALANRLPDLGVSAREVSASVMHGMHGRRRAGPGEAFWQFRPFTPGESTSRIDWRRSARDDRTYIREREWEAAQTIWIWIDRSPSMGFVSGLAQHSKIDRALIIGLATADLLVRGGERVGLIGLTRPTASRTIVERLVDTLRLAGSSIDDELPPSAPLPPRSRGVLIGDFLSDAEEIGRGLRSLASNGAKGHMIAIADPVEETFPFTGHVELADVGTSARLRLGEARAMRDDYLGRLRAHRDTLTTLCRSLGWTFSIHRTDRKATEALMHLSVLIADAGALPAGGVASAMRGGT